MDLLRKAVHLYRSQWRHPPTWREHLSFVAALVAFGFLAAVAFGLVGR